MTPLRRNTLVLLLLSVSAEVQLVVPSDHKVILLTWLVKCTTCSTFDAVALDILRKLFIQSITAFLLMNFWIFKITRWTQQHLKAPYIHHIWLTGVFFLSLSLTDAFVNSQEWTLSRTVPELKVVSRKDLKFKFVLVSWPNLKSSFRFFWKC